MSTNNMDFDNAALIIEKFGGIRPMANKTNIPVTTIQGWKKRGAIPKGRRDEILAFATQNDIDLTGSLNLKDVPVAPKRAKVDSASNENTKETKEKTRKTHATNDTALEERFAMIEKKMTRKTLMTGALAALAAVAFMYFLFGMDSSNDLSSEDARIASLEEKIEEMEKTQTSAKNFFSKSFSKQLEGMQDQMMVAVENAKGAGGTVLAENIEHLENRLIEVEDQLEAFTTPEQQEQIQNWRLRLQGLQESLSGQEKAKASLSELNAVLNDTDVSNAEPDRVNNILDGARAQSAALKETMDGVPTQDLKAAAMLLAMNQFRSSLNRDNQPFNDDLSVLQSLAGEENLELQQSLEKLAPHARNGVLTPVGLKEEFKTLSGDVIVGSLKGEDVSVGERASARLNALIQVEKDGEMITGTPTQASLKSAENSLNQDDIEGAISELSKITNPKAQALIRPWISKAQATIAAQRMKRILK